MTTDTPDDTSSILRVALIDVTPDAVDEFSDWFDNQQVDTGQCQLARRYVCSTEPHLSLVVYTSATDRPPVVPTEFRSPFGRRHIRSYFSDTFERTSSHGVIGRAPRFLNAIITQTTAEGAAPFDEWYRLVHVPEILECPGWLGSQRFRSSTSATRFLAMYDLSDLTTPFSTPEYENAVGWDDHDEALLGYHGFRTYELVSAWPTAQD